MTGRLASIEPEIPLAGGVPLGYLQAVAGIDQPRVPRMSTTIPELYQHDHFVARKKLLKI